VADSVFFTPQSDTAWRTKSIKSKSSFNENQPVYFYFKIDKLKTIELKPNEILMIEFKFTENESSFDDYRLTAVQDPKSGEIYGSGIIIPPIAEPSNLSPNSIYGRDFHYEVLTKFKNLSTEGEVLELTVEKYTVMVYDILKGEFPNVAYSPEDRFKQFANGNTFELEDTVSFKLEPSPNYPFDKMITNMDSANLLYKKKLYSDLSSVTPAPKEYLKDNFTDIKGEIDRKTVESLLKNFFEGSSYSLKNIVNSNIVVRVTKDQKGIPLYKQFYAGFYATNQNGKCAWGFLTIRSDFAGTSYLPWKGDTNKINDCICEK
jgi:hypothetical protein